MPIDGHADPHLPFDSTMGTKQFAEPHHPGRGLTALCGTGRFARSRSALPILPVPGEYRSSAMRKPNISFTKSPRHSSQRPGSMHARCRSTSSTTAPSTPSSPGGRRYSSTPVCSSWSRTSTKSRASSHTRRDHISGGTSRQNPRCDSQRLRDQYPGYGARSGGSPRRSGSGGERHHRGRAAGRGALVSQL